MAEAISGVLMTGWMRTCAARWFLLLLLVAVWPAVGIAEDAVPTADCFPHAVSKKGLQVEMVDDALALGVKHAALNVNLSQLIAPLAAPDDPAFLHWVDSGKTFSFHRAAIEQLDHRIKSLSDHGVLVYLILLAYESGDVRVNHIMLHPGYDSAAPNRLGAFNTETEEGRAWLSGTVHFLAERWSRADEQHGRVVGYIVGNEVNSHWSWYNMGRVTMHEFAGDYLIVLRLVHDAVRKHSSWARVYVSLDHFWNMRPSAGGELQAFPGKEFIDYLARRCQEDAAGNFDWHVAYHPYPENLFEPRFWKDASALPNADTPRITFKNLEVLTEYLRRPELLVDGRPRRVILSEQGFHTPNGPDGEEIQAAAYCLAYRKVESLEGIDAFVLHRHVDHPHEGGLMLGLRRYLPTAADPRPAKLIYHCFRQADEPDWEMAFEFALPIVGIRNWAVVAK
jgi:hypothetical protein